MRVKTDYTKCPRILFEKIEERHCGWLIQLKNYGLVQIGGVVVQPNLGIVHCLGKGLSMIRRMIFQLSNNSNLLQITSAYPNSQSRRPIRVKPKLKEVSHESISRRKDLDGLSPVPFKKIFAPMNR